MRAERLLTAKDAKDAKKDHYGTSPAQEMRLRQATRRIRRAFPVDST